MNQQYDSYKPSGIDWIGDIPSHWNIRKTSQLFHGIGSGTTPTSGNNKYYCENGINWLQTGDLNDGQINETSKRITELAIKDFSSLRLYPKASIVIAMYGATIGKLGILNIQTTTNQACCVLPNSKEINQNFGFYAYRAGRQSLINSAYGGGQPNISQETIKSFRIALPPLAEQETIAAWLDDKCGEIDAAIAKVDREIELIDELKQSEISRVVTRGLNPDAPLRPSGIDWIGDIPEHWTILPLKRISSMFGRIGYRGYTIQDLRVEGEGAITLSPSNMVDGDMNFENVSYLSWEKYYESPEIKIQNGDILFVKTGSTFGKTSYVNNLPMEATINPQILRIVPKIHKKFLAYSMGTPYSQALTDCYVVGSTIPTISQESIGNFLFCVPPIAEQSEIADYLDKKCAEIDGLKAKLTKKRETLTELRQSIISEVVTGKRKVI